MEIFYIALFAAFLLLLGGVELGKSTRDRILTTDAFSAFKNNYLLVYCLMMGQSVPSSLSLHSRSFFLWKALEALFEMHFHVHSPRHSISVRLWKLAFDPTHTSRRFLESCRSVRS
jgi:hypothetical protein